MMQPSPTIVHLIKWPLLTVALSLAACGSISPGVTYLATNGTGEKLRTKTTVGTTAPDGCPTTTVSVPTSPNGLTVSYREPSTNAVGTLLTNLLLTSVYISSPHSQTQVIRIWTNDPRGGGTVTIRNIIPAAPQVSICVTSTNIAGHESAPVSQPQPK
ncbi:MAG: hypothetical protein Q8L74_06705 [Nitrospirota bacterium]|nr:hypothetical protein [Nitrospirota bacterium]MDP2384617.1 hypothetical protein [Nitrospirota bacterium]MDP3598275.1 hypothetical protein [Nitrospirota bacterium]